MRLLEINAAQVQDRLVQFIKDHSAKLGYRRVVLGLSGGIDSSLAAYLAVAALGKNGLIGVLMPHRISNPQSTADARNIPQLLDIATYEVDITPGVEAFAKAFPDMNQVQLGNAMARCRMIVLYQISAQEKALVMGTSNKSEILLGYGTLFGDLACAFNPLGDLYKTQIKLLAEHVGVPAHICQKVPSADLWAGQSDEGELGLTYDEADRFFVRWIDHRWQRDALIAEGFSPVFMDRVIQRVLSQKFKHELPTIPRVSSRTGVGAILDPQEWLK